MSEAAETTVVDRTPRTVRGALAFVLGALVVIAAVEVVALFAPPPPSPWQSDARFYPPTRVPTVEESTIHWQLERLKSEDADVVILGDSSALMGVVPQAFEDVLGVDAENFGTICWLTVGGHVDILERYLELHGPPRVVVYQMATLVHSVPHAEIVGSGMYDELRSYLGLDQDDAWLPSLRWRDAARVAVEGRRYAESYLSQRRGRDLSDIETRDFLAANDGWNIDRAPRPTWEGLRAVPASMQPEALASLQRLFALADRHGFDLYVLHTPLPQVLDQPGIAASYDAVEQSVRAAAEPFDRVRVIGPFARFFRTDAFADVEHLTPDGAWSHSVGVARLLAAELGTEDSEDRAGGSGAEAAP